MIDYERLAASLSEKKASFPFDHWLMENFFDKETALRLESEFLDYDDAKWFCYDNSLEDKKALNDWNAFPTLTYQVFKELLSTSFINRLSHAIGCQLWPDPGLHGGGWHIHKSGGRLNPHLDYSIHPKLGLQRKLNLIIYLSSPLKEEHGGHLGLWTHDPERGGPGQLTEKIAARFNTAVLFDTTQNSWHGICRPLTQPGGVYRKSLAVYYLTEPPAGADQRQRALFAPTEQQRDNEEVLNLIQQRADSVLFAKGYRTGKGDSPSRDA